MRILFRFGLFFSILLAAPRLSAQDECRGSNERPRTADAASSKLQQLRVSSCLGGSSCTAVQCQRFTSWFKDKDAQGAVELLTAIRNSAATAETSPNLNKLVDRIDAWIAVVGSDALATSAPGQWQYDIDRGGLFLDTPYSIAVDSTLEARCQAVADACAVAFEEAVEILTDATLVRRVNGALLTPQRDSIVKYVTALDKRWDDYFNRTPSQFPWELALNSAFYQRHERRGYNEPPKSQWILLHPALAYEYTDQESDRFKSALALEALGYFRGHVGIAAVVEWADRENGSKAGYGAALHWGNKAMIGAVWHRHSSQTSIVVSPQLEKLVTSSAAKIRKVFTRPGM